jgi:hypothetical protein
MIALGKNISLLTPTLSPKGRGGNLGHWDFGHYLVIGAWGLVLHQPLGLFQKAQYEKLIL